MKNIEDIFVNISNSIGWTPLKKFYLENGKCLFAKLEWMNQYGSIKDRVAIALLKDLYINRPEVFHSDNYEIVEYTGGNLGIALANMCFLLGLKLHLVLPDGISKQLIQELENLNVKIHLVDKNQGFFGIMQYSKKMIRNNRKYILLYQHRNYANLSCHYNGTAVEIIEQIKNNTDISKFAFVCSIGTGASLIGNYLKLKEFFEINLYATSPFEMPYGTLRKPYAIKKFAGSGGLGHGLKQFFVYNYEREIKKHFQIKLADCYATSKAFYKLYGIPLGTSSSANYLAAEQISMHTGLDVITLFPSLLDKGELSCLKIL